MDVIRTHASLWRRSPLCHLCPHACTLARSVSLPEARLLAPAALILYGCSERLACQRVPVDARRAYFCLTCQRVPVNTRGARFVRLHRLAGQCMPARSTGSHACCWTPFPRTPPPPRALTLHAPTHSIALASLCVPGALDAAAAAVPPPSLCRPR
eukprot:366286-Chlamydomonas_euryale.AAC.2